MDTKQSPTNLGCLLEPIKTISNSHSYSGLPQPYFFLFFPRVGAGSTFFCFTLFPELTPYTLGLPLGLVRSDFIDHDPFCSKLQNGGLDPRTNKAEKNRLKDNYEAYFR